MRNVRLAQVLNNKGTCNLFSIVYSKTPRKICAAFFLVSKPNLVYGWVSSWWKTTAVFSKRKSGSNYYLCGLLAGRYARSKLAVCAKRALLSMSIIVRSPPKSMSPDIHLQSVISFKSCRGSTHWVYIHKQSLIRHLIVVFITHCTCLSLDRSHLSR